MIQSREIHYRYIVGILLASMVAIIALYFSGQKDLVGKFDFAATLSSLLLALVAIVYAVASGLKQEIQLGRLTETNVDIRSAANEMRSLASDISSFAKDAPKHFELISSKIDTMRDGFATLERDEGPVSSDSDAAPDMSADKFRDFFFDLQLGAMVAFYFFWRAERKSQAFSSVDYVNASNGNFEYAMGVFTVLEARGLIRFTYHKEEVIPQEASAAVQANLKNCIKVITDDASTNFSRSLAERVRIVDKFFDSPPSSRESDAEGGGSN